MRHIVATLTLVVLAAAARAPICRADETITCPKRAGVSEGHVVPRNVPAGFEFLVESRSVLLSGVSIFDGPPAEGASLKPTTSTADGSHVKWVLAGATERGTWVSCDYANGLIHLARKLRQPVSACTATVRKSGSPLVLGATFRCSP